MTQTASPSPHRVAVLGAAGTGKTRLTTALIAAWGRSPLPPPILVSDNPLLTFDTTHGSPGGFDHVLLMGLDLPVENTSACDREVTDRALRETLAKTGQPFTVIYGEGPARLANALRALSGHGWAPAESAGHRQPWVWACDTCSDPDCERRLLSGLLAARAP